VWEPGIEPWLEGKRSSLHVPGTVLLLSAQQELSAALVCRIGNRQPPDLERHQTFSGPSLLPHTVSLCVGILMVITILNLRGVRDAGLTFAVPTYLFVGTLLITIVAGVLRVLLSGGHPTPAAPLPAPPRMTEAVRYWLLLKVFASGCTALTGVEAVSNGVKAFREPAVKNARRTLTVIIFLPAVLLAGISYLVKIYGIAATDVRLSERIVGKSIR
jgi:amino acid transporter